MLVCNPVLLFYNFEILGLLFLLTVHLLVDGSTFPANMRIV